MVSELYIFILTLLLIFFCVSTNTMYAVFSFIAYALLLFISFFFFKIEFITYLFFIIYLGAIIVLFLFVILLIEFKPLTLDSDENAFVKIILIFFCFYSFLLSVKSENINTNLLLNYKTNVKYLNYDFAPYQDTLDIIEIGLIIYDSYLVLFINLTLIFLMGILSVVLLTKSTINTHINLLKS